MPHIFLLPVWFYSFGPFHNATTYESAGEPVPCYGAVGIGMLHGLYLAPVRQRAHVPYRASRAPNTRAFICVSGTRAEWRRDAGPALAASTRVRRRGWGSDDGPRALIYCTVWLDSCIMPRCRPCACARARTSAAAETKQRRLQSIRYCTQLHRSQFAGCMRRWEQPGPGCPVPRAVPCCQEGAGPPGSSGQPPSSANMICHHHLTHIHPLHPSQIGLKNKPPYCTIRHDNRQGTRATTPLPVQRYAAIHTVLLFTPWLCARGRPLWPLCRHPSGHRPPHKSPIHHVCKHKTLIRSHSPTNKRIPVLLLFILLASVTLISQNPAHITHWQTSRLSNRGSRTGSKPNRRLARTHGYIEFLQLLQRLLAVISRTSPGPHHVMKRVVAHTRSHAPQRCSSWARALLPPRPAVQGFLLFTRCATAASRVSWPRQLGRTSQGSPHKRALVRLQPLLAPCKEASAGTFRLPCHPAGRCHAHAHAHAKAKGPPRSPQIANRPETPIIPHRKRPFAGWETLQHNLTPVQAASLTHPKCTPLGRQCRCARQSAAAADSAASSAIAASSKRTGAACRLHIAPCRCSVRRGPLADCSAQHAAPSLRLAASRAPLPVAA